VFAGSAWDVNGGMLRKLSPAALKLPKAQSTSRRVDRAMAVLRQHRPLVTVAIARFREAEGMVAAGVAVDRVDTILWLNSSHYLKPDKPARVRFQFINILKMGFLHTTLIKGISIIYPKLNDSLHYLFQILKSTALPSLLLLPNNAQADAAVDRRAARHERRLQKKMVDNILMNISNPSEP
jgi:hypothetical protein